MQPTATTPTAASASALPADDIVLPFQAERSAVMGRVVRLGGSVHDVLTRHDYPEPVSQALGQAIALTAMLGTTLKEQSKLILQTQTDGPLRLLVVNFESPGQFRGYARFDRDRVAATDPRDQGQLLGRGHLGMTIDLGRHTEPYQGIVALEGETLAEAALTYFQRSAQLPTFIRLAVARHYAGGPSGGGPNRGENGGGQWRWRAGGLMLQHLSSDRGDAYKGAHALPDAAPDEDRDEAWERTRALASTVEDHELLDPTLAPDRLLLRLFHEEGVRVYPTHAMAMRCRCSRDKIERMLRMFSQADVADMTEPDGSLSVTCEFCTSTQLFTGDELAGARAGVRP